MLYFGEERHAFKVEESSFSFVVAQAGGAGSADQARILVEKIYAEIPRI